MSAAALKGTYRIISVDGGEWIRAGDQNFPTDMTTDPAIVVEYFEAFKNLCNRGFVDHDTSHLFKLTVAGFKKARSLAGY